MAKVGEAGLLSMSGSARDDGISRQGIWKMEKIVDGGRGGEKKDSALKEGRKVKCGEESDPNLKVGSVFRSFSPASSIRIESWKRECRRENRSF